METILWIVFQSIHYPFRLLLLPLAGLAPLWPMIVVSLLTGLLMLWVYSKVSAQGRIREAKNRIRGNLLAVRLFQHDIRVVLQLQVRILQDTFSYLKHSLAPVLVLLVPVVLILAQVNLYFALRPLRPGETALIQAEVAERSAALVQVSLVAPPGIEVDSPAVRAANFVAWRIRANQPGNYRMKLSLDGETVEKEVVVGENWQAVSPLRSASLLDYILYPGEARIDPSGAIRTVHLNYSALPIRLFGWNVHWLVLFFVLSVVFSFALKGLFGVEL